MILSMKEAKKSAKDMYLLVIVEDKMSYYMTLPAADKIEDRMGSTVY